MAAFPNLPSLAVALALSFAASGAALAYSGEIYVTCGLNPQGDNFLALRRCGSTSCAMTHKLGPGTYMLSFEPYGTNGWRQVSILNRPNEQDIAGPTGWVFERYICQVRP
ncbi:hypothetical protein [Aliiruegeria lutimaris]|uniref:SH3 domain-containing protein n=1 Tax=Aliiruegeria lutimaris TaxID=571298 RepID=A0A1G8PK03_9RHOB|nr:hypothetical protein [Aliiruegeria lutimaris]SDI92861.1 hypothetical protein SAMN04488026_100928 [Aliiruegeria lutimaris]